MTDGVVMSPHAWMLLGYLIFVTLNVVDLLVTKVILEKGGKEWNFVARFFYRHLGIIRYRLVKGHSSLIQYEMILNEERISNMK